MALDDIIQTSRDVLALPQSLLSPFKQHERIDHCDDDELIVGLIETVIDRFEALRDVIIFRSVYEWAPSEFTDRIQIPYPPASGFTANVGIPATDVTASYRLATKSLAGIPRQWLLGEWQDELRFVITAGYLPETLPAGLRNVFLRTAGHLYEYREILVGRDVQSLETWIDDSVGGYWQPYA